MIRIRKIKIEEFRGIRDLELDLNKKNFGICGPNGTGKSGVVDAIEFCFTGDVTRLSGSGSSGVSVKAHAPHVDQSNNPEKSKVTIEAFIPSLNKEVTISRCVKTATKVDILPPDEKIIKAVSNLQYHPEFALSRREIVKYIITPPGKRSEDVRTLLRLDHLEKLRKSLTTFQNRRKTEKETADRTHKVADADLRAGLQITKLDRKLVLEKVNEQRVVLALEPITELKKDTSFKHGVNAEAKEDGKTDKADIQKQPPKKATALADIKQVTDELELEESKTVSASRKSAIVALEKLKDDDQAIALAKQHGFITTGLSMVSEDACPLCDTKWDEAELRKHLEAKLLNAKELGDLLRELKANFDAVEVAIATRKQSMARIVEYCKKLEPKIDHSEIDKHILSLDGIKVAIANFSNDNSLVQATIDALNNEWWIADSEAKAEIAACTTALNDLPDPSKERQAIDFLATAQERYEKLLRAAAEAKRTEAEFNVAKIVVDHYNATCTGILENIYDQVADDFSKFYRAINRDDEESFIGTLKSAPAKLNFDVDFYGRGLFPPGAYHSEGHQDGMGLCLYLALMKHTLGSDFTFAVLDDVLMSVDKGHRREVCRLLNTEFPHTQFILTTHDRVWLQYMKTENLIEKSQLFGGWSVDTGPRVWNDLDIWIEIADELGKDNVERAAWLLRRYLEYVANVLADSLRVNIEFRGDGNYMLADLLPPVLKQWKKYLEDGEAAATNWEQDDVATELKEARESAKVSIAKSETEKWAVNPAVHYNEWANFEAHEFEAVVAAFRELLEMLRCDNDACKSYLHVSPYKGPRDAMRCNCGKVNINLKKK